MTVTVPLIGIVILIVILHTIIHHLINWGIRKAWKEIGGESIVFLLCVLTIAEVAICLALMSYYIQ